MACSRQGTDVLYSCLGVDTAAAVLSWYVTDNGFKPTFSPDLDNLVADHLRLITGQISTSLSDGLLRESHFDMLQVALIIMSLPSKIITGNFRARKKRHNGS